MDRVQRLAESHARLLLAADARDRRRPPLLDATPEQRRQRYARWLNVATDCGYKLGWARHRYRSTFGVWPRGMADLEATEYGV